MDANLVDAIKELMDFIDGNNVCDEHHINWLTDEDCYIENSRSDEMEELLDKVKEAIGDEND